jgi:hypothetical protein
MCLRGVGGAVGTGAHTQIRINVGTISTFIFHGFDLIVKTYLSQWRGYKHLDWNEQISIQRQSIARETISVETFAQHVGRKVSKFMEVILIMRPKHSPGN